jgi:predicted DNA-binding transcriptional regulator AlpA
MTEPQTQHGKLYTLSEISQRTGISMPTLQRYKKMYQDRIPAEGKGRKQRYPESALPVFDQIRNENLGRRGRPRKDPNAPRPARPTPTKSTRGRKPAAKTAAAEAPRGRGRKAAAAKRPAAAPAAAARGGRGRKASGGAAASKATGTKRANLLTLTQISEQTGISYPTLVRYVRMHSDRLPHEGKGRGRRFYPEAVNVFRQLRQESGRGGRKPAAAKAPAARRGRPPGSGRGRAAAAGRGGQTEDPGLLKRLREIEKSHLDLEKRFRDFAKGLQRLFR